MELTLLIAGVLGLLIFAVIWIARSWGKASAERDLAEDSVEDAREANEIDEDTALLTDAELRERLRDNAKRL